MKLTKGDNNAGFLYRWITIAIAQLIVTAILKFRCNNHSLTLVQVNAIKLDNDCVQVISKIPVQQVVLVPPKTTTTTSTTTKICKLTTMMPTTKKTSETRSRGNPFNLRIIPRGGGEEKGNKELEDCSSSHFDATGGAGIVEAEVSRSNRSSVAAATTIATSISESSIPTTDLAMNSAKWNGLRNRILSTFGIISSLVALSYLFREDGLVTFVVVLQFLMYREMTRMIGGDDWGSSVQVYIRKYWWFVTAVIAWNGNRLYPWKSHELGAITFGLIISNGLIASIMGFQFNCNSKIEFREYIRQTAVSLLSAMLVVLPSSYWIGTLEEYGMKWIFFPATFVAINDIMAYVFGKFFGKHPLVSYISPNKTWEGFVGAAIATVGTAWIALVGGGVEKSSPIIGPGLKGITRFDGMVLATYSSLVAPFAGFLASVIKRAFGRKDFGTILPGHGGILDRLDCQLILAPFVYFYLSLFKFATTSGTPS